jgi:hypothetical protein
MSKSSGKVSRRLAILRSAATISWINTNKARKATASWLRMASTYIDFTLNSQLGGVVFVVGRLG